ncbi:hypothetical protein [Streptomyces sp. NRRL B-24484]|uniref:hypothetical protein n=1 Tax=Streptomyces sp. NRRL B-24484 TaxID=1463833 RepID=UPI0004C055BA|nr:hypothetical protein [Streptomyces sp. NRRL B-24484]
MGYDLHVQAVSADELTKGAEHLSAFMAERWHAYEDHASDIRFTISKSFVRLDELYRSAAHLPGGDAAALPMGGGEPVLPYGDPVMALMGPAEVRRAAEFLAAHTFDDLWEIGGAAAAAGSGNGSRVALAYFRQDLAEGDADARAFYARAAAAGLGAVSAAWF